jgi:hypothetical protein
MFVLVIACSWPTAAGADQTVVSATIYPSSGAGVSHRSVSLSTLEGCPLFAGSNPMYLYPSQSPYQWATDSTWSVATVAQCALSIPTSALTDVQVRSPSQGYESLSGSDVTDPGRFHDPLAPVALPVISSESGEDLNTYFRPWRGGTDRNAQDKVTEFGAPVTIVIFEHGTPLTVAITSTKAGSTKVKLSATVRNSRTALVPATALHWSWDFGDSSTSTLPAPTHSYAAGRYIVTLSVADSAAGTGGTATTTVTIGSQPGTGTHQPGGGGPSGSGSPTGPARSRGTHPGGPAGSSRGGSTPSGAAGPASTTTTSSRSPAGPHSAKQATDTHARPSRSARSSPASSPAQLVTGRLISYVTPVAANASPLVRAVPGSAPAARRAASTSPMPGLAGGVVIVLLFGLGAGNEFRGRRDRRAFRFGG